MFSLKNRFRCFRLERLCIFSALLARYSLRLIKLKFQAVSWDVTHIEASFFSLPKTQKKKLRREKNKFQTQVCLNKAKQHLCMENNTDSCAL
jgi:hypothetical protein